MGWTCPYCEWWGWQDVKDSCCAPTRCTTARPIRRRIAIKNNFFFYPQSARIQVQAMGDSFLAPLVGDQMDYLCVNREHVTKANTLEEIILMKIIDNAIINLFFLNVKSQVLKVGCRWCKCLSVEFHEKATSYYCMRINQERSYHCYNWWIGIPTGRVTVAVASVGIKVPLLVW